MIKTHEQPRETLKRVLRERVAERLDATGKTMHEVSIAIGANSGYVRDLLDPEKTGIPSAERAQLLARELGTTSDYLLGRAESSAPVLSEITLLDRQWGWQGPERAEMGVPLLGTGDCADMIVKGEDGHTVEIEQSSFDPDYTVRYLERPRALLGEKDAYAIEFNGGSMEPRYFAGERGIALPSRHAGPGDFVVVQLNDGTSHDVTTVMVKRLIGRNSREIVLEQYNPPMVFTVPRSRVERLHRLVRPEDLL